MTQELREKVRLIMARLVFGDEAETELEWHPTKYQPSVDAAIAIIRGETLEEAAKVAEDKTIGANGNHAFDGPWVSACHTIAAAIRALKDKP